MATTKKQFLNRIHKHDIKVKVRDQTTTIISHADFEKKLDMMTDKLPKLKTDTFEILEALYRAEEFEEVTRHYGTDAEEHFGFTVREYDDTIEWVQINFEYIPNIIFCAATRCRNETIDFDKMIVYKDSSKNFCVLNVEMLEELHNLFVDVMGYCRDVLNDHHINDTRFFYVYSNDDDLKTWIVPARDIEVLCEGLSKQSSFEIEDDGFTLSFETIPLAFLEKEEFIKESDRCKLMHLSEAIRRIMIDYFMSKDNDK
jgi:hypothetical protein